MDAIAEHEELERSWRRPISVKNVERSFATIKKKYPPILSHEQAAELAGIAPSTLKRHVSEGRYKYCVSRGKPLLFFRDRFVAELFR